MVEEETDIAIFRREGAVQWNTYKAQEHAAHRHQVTPYVPVGYVADEETAKELVVVAQDIIEYSRRQWAAAQARLQARGVSIVVQDGER